jgi:hypothetical protein
MGQDNEGGNNGKADKVSTVTLTLDRATFQMAIGGLTQNYDEAIAMRQMAIRRFERLQNAAEIQAALNKPQIAGGMPRMPLNFGHRG